MLVELFPTIILQLVVLLCIYLLVAVSIFLDLWAGIRKAKARGEYRSSAGFRKTVDKFCRYFNMLLAVTVIDALAMLICGLLNHVYGYHIPVLPFITAAGACFICFIEVKSIFEKNDKKEQAKIQAAAADLRRLMQEDGARDVLAAALAIIQQGKPAGDGSAETAPAEGAQIP